jgi:hypothetical protein
VLVKGASQVGKTSLLARGLQEAREAGARILRTDFQLFNEAAMASAGTLLAAVAETLAHQLDLGVPPPEGWSPAGGPNVGFQRFIQREVLGRAPERIVWGMDGVDRLFTCPFGGEIFTLFRSWHNERALDPGGPWGRLTLAIAYATEAHLFITDLNRSPFNVGTRLTLDDFTLEQVADLNRRCGAPLESDAAVARFYHLLGGHPYLVRRALHELAACRLDLAELESCAGRRGGFFGDHLQRLLAALERDPDLAAVARSLLRGQPCPSPESFYRLRTAGVITGTSEADARVRCRLYAAYFARYLR